MRHGVATNNNGWWNKLNIIDIIQGPYFTPDQYNQILKLLNKECTSETLIGIANIASTINTFLEDAHRKQWIIDSRATNHMVSDINMLSTKKKSDNTKIKIVHLPNRKITVVTYIDSCKLTNKIEINDVLYIQEFRCNLLSISKITKKLQCSVYFILYLYIPGPL